MGSLDSFAMEEVRKVFEVSPNLPLYYGIPGYEDKVTDLTLEGIRKTADILRDLIKKVKTYEAETDEERITLEGILAQLRRMLISVREFRREKKDPLFYLTDLDGLYLLLIRNLPKENKAKGAAAKIKAIPTAVETAMRQLKAVPRVWAEYAIKAIGGYKALIDIARRALAPNMDEKVASEAKAALDEFAAFLKKQKERHPYHVGRGTYHSLIMYGNALDMTPEELRGFGKRLFDVTLRKIKTLLDEEFGGKSFKEVLKGISKDHPSEEELKKAYEEELRSLVAFLKDRNVVPFPQHDVLTVEDTPEFLRPFTPYAAYSSPGPFEKEGRGIFYVSRVESEEQLREHAWPILRLVALHEAYPGHHLQLSIHNEIESDARKLVLSDSVVEGWAFYCEQLMVELGYLKAPEERLAQLKDQLWRAARVLIDSSIHLGEMSIEEGVELLVDEVGLSKESAWSEVVRYSMEPFQPSSYAVGKDKILELRAKFGAERDEKKLYEFHKRLLYLGSLPIGVVVKALG